MKGYVFMLNGDPKILLPNQLTRFHDVDGSRPAWKARRNTQSLRLNRISHCALLTFAALGCLNLGCLRMCPATYPHPLGQVLAKPVTLIVPVALFSILKLVACSLQRSLKTPEYNDYLENRVNYYLQTETIPHFALAFALQITGNDTLKQSCIKNISAPYAAYCHTEVCRLNAIDTLQAMQFAEGISQELFPQLRTACIAMVKDAYAESCREKVRRLGATNALDALRFAEGISQELFSKLRAECIALAQTFYPAYCHAQLDRMLGENQLDAAMQFVVDMLAHDVHLQAECQNKVEPRYIASCQAEIAQHITNHKPDQAMQFAKDVPFTTVRSHLIHIAEDACNRYYQGEIAPIVTSVLTAFDKARHKEQLLRAQALLDKITDPEMKAQSTAELATAWSAYHTYQVTQLLKVSYDEWKANPNLDPGLRAQAYAKEDITDPIIQKACLLQCEKHWLERIRRKLKLGACEQADDSARHIIFSKDAAQALFDKYCTKHIRNKLDKNKLPRELGDDEPRPGLIEYYLKHLSAEKQAEMRLMCNKAYSELVDYYISKKDLSTAKKYVKGLTDPELKQTAMDACDRFASGEVMKWLESARTTLSQLDSHPELTVRSLHKQLHGKVKEHIDEIYSDDKKAEAEMACDQFCAAQVKILFDHPPEVLAQAPRWVQEVGLWSDNMLDSTRRIACRDETETFFITYLKEKVGQERLKGNKADAREWLRIFACESLEPIFTLIETTKRYVNSCAKSKPPIGPLMTTLEEYRIMGLYIHPYIAKHAPNGELAKVDFNALRQSIESNAVRDLDDRIATETSST